MEGAVTEFVAVVASSLPCELIEGGAGLGEGCGLDWTAVRPFAACAYENVELDMSATGLLGVTVANKRAY
jgi:hypothetical protein